MVMDLISSEPDSERISRDSKIQTIAVGAPTFADIALGGHDSSLDPVREFLRLRVYQIEYRSNIYERKVSPNLHLVAKGNPTNAYRYCSNIEILGNYWLA